jgi:hypothetical protein
VNVAAGNHRSGSRTRLCWVLLLACLFAVWPLERKIQVWTAESASGGETLYVTSGKTLRRLSMGYEGLLADLYWTRAVQYFGRRRLAHVNSYPLLGTLLRITTDLDPHLLVAYRFGAIFLAEKPPSGAGEPNQALELVRKGIVANPDYWRFWEDLGFIYYWDLKDYAHAARAFETGSQRPGAYVWMRAMAATIAAQGGDLNVSRMLWSEVYRHAGTETVKRSALAHLAAIEAAEEMSQLDHLLADYARKQGRAARSFQDLVDAGYLHSIHLDPSNAPFVLGPDGQARLSPRSGIDPHLLP